LINGAFVENRRGGDNVRHANTTASHRSLQGCEVLAGNEQQVSTPVQKAAKSAQATKSTKKR